MAVLTTYNDYLLKLINEAYDGPFPTLLQATTSSFQPPSPLQHVAPLPLVSEEDSAMDQQTTAEGGDVEVVTVKKSGARRNPWGNMSYADLITQAVTSAPDHRLTLAQIYEWLVKNVPYFHGKGDNISSIGWKVRTIEAIFGKFLVKGWGSYPF
jgi:hypothetical protein